MMTVNVNILQQIMSYLSDYGEYFEYNLQETRNESFVKAVADYQGASWHPLLTPITPALTPLMMRKVSYSNISKITLVLLVHTELQARGVEIDNKMKIPDLVKLLKENKI